jgi:LmeA-like phospholipid-binding
MRRGLIVTVVILVMVLIAADRIALAVAENQIADRVQKSQDLASQPKVSIKGFPFLTQVLGGRYHEVEVSVRDVTRNDLTVDRLTVRAHGVSVPLSKVMSGSVSEVPVDRADAVVLLGFANLNSYIHSQLGEVLTVSADGKNLKLTGTLPVPPRISLSAQARIDVTGSAITLRPVGVAGVLARMPGMSVATGVVEQFLTVRLPISQLPFGIQLRAATVTPAGLLIAASASGLTIRAPSS